MNLKYFLILGAAALVVPALGACDGSTPTRVVAPAPSPEAVAPAAKPLIASHEPAPAPDLLARRELALGARPLALAALDFDGDGYCDLAVATEKPGRITVLAGGPEGLADAGLALDIGDFPTELAEAEGRLYVGSKATGELLCVQVTRTDDGLAPAVAWRRTPGGVPRSVAAADVDGLGGVEILWATRDDRVLAVKEDGVHGSVQLDLGTRTVGILPLAGASAFALLCQGTNEVLFFAVLPDGNVAARGRVTMDGVPRSGTQADLDGDGDLEAVFVGGDHEVLVFGMNGAALDAEPMRTTQPGTVPAAVRAGDLNRDGRDDLVSLGLIDQGYSVMGEFGANGPSVRISEYAGQDPWDLALGDFDGDGLLDLATACRAANAVSLLSGTGIMRPGKPAFYQATRIGVGGNPLSIAAVDLFGATPDMPLDERPELATLDAADGMLSLLSNDGFGGLRLLTRLPAGASSRGLLAVDAGAEQHVLTALSVPAGGAGRLLAFGRVGNAASTLEVRVTNEAVLPAAGEAQIAAADLDGDGLDDLVMADPRAAQLHILAGRGQSGGRVTFEAQVPIDLPGIASAIAILERPEGKRFVAAIRGALWLLDLNGKPLVQLASPDRARSGRGCGRIVAADLDGDGFDDVASLWLGPQGTSPGLLATQTLGQGMTMIFEKPTGLAPADLGAADLNGDGLAELFVASQNSHLVDLWVNRGTLGPIRGPGLGVGLGPLDLCAADLLGKGYADLIAANAFSADVSIVFNRPRKK